MSGGSMSVKMQQHSNKRAVHHTSSAVELAKQTTRSSNSMVVAPWASRTSTLKITASLYVTVVTASATEDHAMSSSTMSRALMEVCCVELTATMAILVESRTRVRLRRSGVIDTREWRKGPGKLARLDQDLTMFPALTQTQHAELGTSIVKDTHRYSYNINKSFCKR